ncbi:MAG: prepilin-type N-terminal cleavage/methylation domain-containing protein, partial [Synergistaceae bacterium]|nr:prepilin-type N-terminal cleavage/methylation domain-containing protein [Synergistaceae bacterium]
MRKGFTLLELLIVITVIAILGAGIALSTIGIVTTADANVIISNMQQIKTATLIWYKNN